MKPLFIAIASLGIIAGIVLLVIGNRHYQPDTRFSLYRFSFGGDVEPSHRAAQLIGEGTNRHRCGDSLADLGAGSVGLGGVNGAQQTSPIDRTPACVAGSTRNRATQGFL